MSAALLAKLTAKGLAITGEGFGGEVEITSSDVAAALCGLPRPVYLLARLKYCGDESVAKELLVGLANEIIRGEWENINFSKGEAGNYAEAIIEDNLGGDLCGTCNGTGTYRYKDCAGCKGTGKRSPSQSARADRLGQTRHHYRTHGERIFTRYASLLGEWESRALSSVSRQIRGG